MNSQTIRKQNHEVPVYYLKGIPLKKWYVMHLRKSVYRKFRQMFYFLTTYRDINSTMKQITVQSF